MEVGIEIRDIKELVEHRAKDYETIMLALRIQDKLRKKMGDKESTEIIREWRDKR